MKYIQEHITAFILHAVPYLNLVNAIYANKICFCFQQKFSRIFNRHLKTPPYSRRYTIISGKLFFIKLMILKTILRPSTDLRRLLISFTGNVKSILNV